MKKIFSFRWLIGAFIVLFLATQSYSLSHATSFGDEHHDHDGIACHITVIAPDEDLNLPTDGVVFINQAFSFPEYRNGFVTPPFGTFLTRAPPPRGPPTFF